MSGGFDWNDDPDGPDEEPAPAPKKKRKKPAAAPAPESENPAPNGHATNGHANGSGNGLHHWTDKLRHFPSSKNRMPEVMPTYSNLVIILAHDPALAGLLGFDEFRGEPVMLKKPPVDDGVAELPGPYPRPWRQQDISALHSFMERNHSPKFSHPGTVERAMLQVCGNTPIHPVRDWINQLVWDGTERLDGWLEAVFGVPQTPYTRAVARKTLVAAVRRVRQPGCKFDHILVLQGAQDFAKSLAIETLATSQYFSDSLPLNLADKDAMMGLRGRWFIEFGEIEHLARNTSGLTKAFITRHNDIYRAPYGKTQETHPRQCIIFGTTNETHYLRDDTGNRRYWPVLCANHASTNWIEDNREQLFAEAAHWDDKKEQLWIDPKHMPEAHEEAVRAQSARLEAHDDPWGPLIADFVNGKNQPHREDEEGNPIEVKARDYVTVADLLGLAVRVPRGQLNVGHQRRVARILRAMGWFDCRQKTAEGPYSRDDRYWARHAPVSDDAPNSC